MAIGRLGFIGGTGLDDLGTSEIPTSTPENQEPQNKGDLPILDIKSWGVPSASPRLARVGGNDIVVLSRHGPGHRIPPHQINYRGNISVMKQCGVTHLISFSAVGSLSPDFPPGTFVLVEQYIDRTKATRNNTFFEDNCIVAHVSMADPTCQRLNDYIEEIACSLPDLTLKRGGQLVCIDGPQFSTRAEAAMHKQWGCNLVGMTSMTECRLAREAGMCYANIAMVTDYDCVNHTVVSHEAVVGAMKANAAHARELMTKIAEHFSGIGVFTCQQNCKLSLVGAIASAPSQRVDIRKKYMILNNELFA